MRRTALLPVLMALASLLASAESIAAEPADTEATDEEIDEEIEAELDDVIDWRDHRFFVGASGGVAWPTVEHPAVIPSASFTAATLGLHAGYQIREYVSVGLEIASFERYMRRKTGGDLFAPGSKSRPLDLCWVCQPGDPIEGRLPSGYILAISAAFTTVGPRVEFTPFGRDGLYIGAFGGVAFVTGLASLTGVGGAARAGFRLRVAEIITFAAEGGLQAQAFDGGSSLAPYAALMMRPYF